ncbi:hypothetical protein [Sedimenticola thiotaurini]|uniref:DUF2232 domain-containing protein n=1 Tax=Sedimenticola thiotaurini TaxID=1543721 RepID=A0A0F7JXX5_9GAMM|nr:hypothetical protein [Sedimenticola thiotaurini]AKH19533.1 hypothetical protein AAY24_03260 [Sedimenticola thiotaurini]
MRFIASFVMRGLTQAVMSTILLAALSLVIPPASMLSSAVVALVTLRQGASAGALIFGVATVVSGGIALLSLGSISLAIGFLVLLWIPAWLLAVLLRSSRSLSLTVVGGMVLGFVMLGSQFMESADPAADWQRLLSPFVESLVDAQLVEPGQQASLVTTMAGWMPGIIAAGFFLQMVVSLLLARWWQATLYNPGGFRAEFHQLRLPRALSVVLLLVALPLLLQGVGRVTLLEHAVVLLVVAWFIHGLALVHGLVGKLGSSSGWLIGTYLLLLFALPHMMIALAMAGIADAWFDFRARLGPRSPGKAS